MRLGEKRLGQSHALRSATKSAYRDVDDDDPLLVSLLDGTVCAVDRDTGETVWSFSSGGPLVRASGGGGQSIAQGGRHGGGIAQSREGTEPRRSKVQRYYFAVPFH